MALTAPQTAETLITHLAAWRLGAISVPLAPQFGLDALEYRVDDCGATVCIVDPDNLETISTVRDDIDSLEHVLVTDEALATELKDGFWSTLEAQNADVDTVSTEADEDAVIVYTSGTRGTPRACERPIYSSSDCCQAE